MNYLEVCSAATGRDSEPALKSAEGIRSVISGEVSEFLMDYPCHSPEGRHWYYMRAVRMVSDGPVRVVVSHEEITALKLAEEALRESEAALQDKQESLEETNIAMGVLLKKRDEDKKNIEDNVLTNVKELIAPIFKKIKKTKLDDQQKTFLSIIESNLNEIISPFTRRMSLKYLNLTPAEIKIANLIRHGSPTKEIAELLNLSPRTVETHRKNIRRKIGLEGQRANLRSHLLSLH